MVVLFSIRVPVKNSFCCTKKRKVIIVYKLVLGDYRSSDCFHCISCKRLSLGVGGGRAADICCVGFFFTFTIAEPAIDKSSIIDPPTADNETLSSFTNTFELVKVCTNKGRQKLIDNRGYS